MRFLLDSVILIDHFNGIEGATRLLAERGDDAALSVITRAEVLTGFEERFESQARALLDHFPTLPITLEVAADAAKLRRSQRWKLPDALQAAVARLGDLTLVTRNTRDFRPGDPVKLLVPYEI